MSVCGMRDWPGCLMAKFSVIAYMCCYQRETFRRSYFKRDNECGTTKQIKGNNKETRGGDAI